MKSLNILLLWLLVGGVAWAGEYPPAGLDPAFRSYWFDQGAEVSKYELKQVRYGDVHEGHAVLIFVSEPFNSASQVKSDQATAADAVPVLKLNASRKFLTGLYPYSTMTSVFTAMDETGAKPLKLTASVQEWCGQVWMQLNRKPGGYQVRSFSYFETEGDHEVSLPDVVPEDGLWTQIRLDPKGLPTGEFDILPGTLHTRLMHTPFNVMKATARLEQVGGFTVYRLTIRELTRTLKIRFQTAFPHRIESWEEHYPSRGILMKTTATRTHTIFSPYWNKNLNKDRTLRRQLGL